MVVKVREVGTRSARKFDGVRGTVAEPNENMLDEKVIDRIATEVATATLGRQNFSSVISSSAVDSEGHDALRILIIIPGPGSGSEIKGDKSLDTLVEMQRRLRNEGEERFPIVEYATKEELAESGDS